MKNLQMLSIAAVISLYLVAPIAAQTTEINEAAREPFERGLMAAQQQAWELAINHFMLAYERDRESPQIWFNLGLASARVPGRELRAIGWLKAYVEKLPDAPKAQSVRDEIRTLRSRYEITIDKLVGHLKTMANKEPDEQDRRWAMFNIAGIQALAGNIKGAHETAGLEKMPPFEGVNYNQLTGLARELAIGGDLRKALDLLAEARRMTVRINNPEATKWVQDYGYGGVVRALLRDGKPEEARSYAYFSGSEQLQQIACGYFVQGKTAAAFEALKLARDALIKAGSRGRFDLYGIVGRQVAFGDPTGAMETVNLAAGEDDQRELRKSMDRLLGDPAELKKLRHIDWQCRNRGPERYLNLAVHGVKISNDETEYGEAIRNNNDLKLQEFFPEIANLKRFNASAKASYARQAVSSLAYALLDLVE
jgi:hypothetical protein